MTSNSSRPLAGQAALITGAGTGIGRAAAIALAAAGAAVSLSGRRVAPLEETAALAREHDVPVRCQSLDVADNATVERWVSDAREAFGRIDLLVNSAGTNAPTRTWGNTGLESWNELIATNLTGVFQCTRAVLPAMRAQKNGLVINVSSMAGVQASLVSGVAYSASKYGVVSLTQSLNLEEWRNGIRATVVCPGEVNTPIMARRPNPPPSHAYPLMLQPEDLGATIVFLASLPPRALVEQILIRPATREY
ncbi:MAG: SDR family oxidoreductase [Chloroflexota bacterium]